MWQRRALRWILACLVLIATLLIVPTTGAGRTAEPPFTDLFPPSFNSPTAAVGDASGNLWFAEEAAGRIGRVTPQGEFAHFNLPELSDRIERLVIGPDSAVWFVARRFIRPGDDFVGRVAPSGAITIYEYPDSGVNLSDLAIGQNNTLLVLASTGVVAQVGLDGSFTPKYRVPRPASSLVLGPDGNLWVGGWGRIMRVIPGGEVTEFPLSNKDWEIYTLIAGPDNALWFVPARVLSNLRLVGRITTDGTISEFPVAAPGLIMVGDISSGPNNTVWLTLVGTNLLGSLSSDGKLTTSELPPALRATDEELRNLRPLGAQNTELLAQAVDGGLWLTRGWRQPEQVGYRARDGAITAFPTTPPLTPLGLAIGPDSAVWFSEGASWFRQGGTRLGRLAPNGTVAVVYDSGAGGQPLKFGGMVTGPDGNLWAIADVPTISRSQPFGVILRISPSGQIIDRFVVQASGTITAGPDGALWFTQGSFSSARIGRITTDGQMSYIALPTRYLSPAAIVAGPDGNLWVTGSSGYNGELWRITPAGAVTTFALPKEVFLPLSIIAGPDGNLWFAADMTINRITPDGQITSFQLSGYRPPLYDYIIDDYVPRGLTVGPDGNIWFTRYSHDDIPSSLGRITMEGTISEFPFPAGGSYPGAIVSGADGKLYVSARGIRQLIRVDIGALHGGAPAPIPSAVPSQPPRTPTITPYPRTPTPQVTATPTPPPVPGMPNTGAGRAAGQVPLASGFLLVALLALGAFGWRIAHPRSR